MSKREFWTFLVIMVLVCGGLGFTFGESPNVGVQEGPDAIGPLGTIHDDLGPFSDWLPGSDLIYTVTEFEDGRGIKFQHAYLRNLYWSTWPTEEHLGVSYQVMHGGVWNWRAIRLADDSPECSREPQMDCTMALCSSNYRECAECENAQLAENMIKAAEQAGPQTPLPDLGGTMRDWDDGMNECRAAFL